jgi:hypothetical protein
MDPAAPTSAARRATTAALPGLSDGSLAVIDVRSLVISRGTSGASGGISSCSCAIAVAMDESRRKGDVPVRHWIATTPSAYRSDCGVA